MDSDSFFKLSKNLKSMKFRIFFFILSVGLLISCGGDSDPEVPKALPPSNLIVNTEIEGASADNPEGDGSGKVKFSATANNATAFRLEYNDVSQTMTNGNLTVTFEMPGIQEYDVKITAIGASNGAVSTNVMVEVKREYEVPADLLKLLTNDSSQKWRIKSESDGHMGVGPLGAGGPEYWSAKAFEKESTSMYDDVFIFETDNSFTHKTVEAVYGKAGPLESDLGSSTEPVNEDDEIENYPLSDYSGTWQYAPINGDDVLFLSDNGFLGFYIGGTHAYTIIATTEKEMVLRTEGADNLSWFFILTTEEEAVIPADPEFTNLVWSDEFDVAGSPDANNWAYDIGDGSGPNEPGKGWGNNEEQYYTDRSENVIVEEGVLKIIAKKESFGGSSYTSTRMKTQGKYNFTYGRVDIKAKLPAGGGTWPALWMLGTNITAVSWPACGEIDIMEYVGNNPGHVQSALHTPSSFGNTVNYKRTDIENENDDYHIYSMIWSADQISFLLDGERYYTYNPLIKNSANWPFDKSQFLIMNIAMGGNLGGNIDPSFSQSEMVIDYVRIYQ